MQFIVKGELWELWDPSVESSSGHFLKILVKRNDEAYLNINNPDVSSGNGVGPAELNKDVALGRSGRGMVESSPNPRKS